MTLRARVTSAGKPTQDTDVPNDEDTDKTSKTGEVSIFGRRINKIIFIVHLNICLYAVSFFIQVGTLPYLSKMVGLDPMTFGYLQTTFAVVQLAGGPIFGRYGDLYGGRAALTLAFGSAAVSYGLMMISFNAPLLFLSRMPSIFMHAMQAGQMVVTDVCHSSKRAEALGKLGISYGVGMVIGPFVGGLMTRHLSVLFAAAVACATSSFSVIMCYIYIPSKTKPIEQTVDDSAAKQVAVFSLSKVLTLLKQPKSLMLLSVKAVSGIPIGVFQSMFSVVAIDTFKLRPDQNGYILSYVGVLSMITQGFGIGLLSKHMSEMNIIKLAAVILSVSYLLLAYIQTVIQLCIVLIPLCIGLTLMSVVISSALTHTVPDTDTGVMLGMNMAVNSLIRTISPTIGGIMLSAYGFPSIGYLGFINSLLVTIYMFLQQ